MDVSAVQLSFDKGVFMAGDIPIKRPRWGLFIDKPQQRYWLGPDIKGFSH